MNPLANPAILFFVFGIFAGGVRSNLEIPASISKFLSLYLLMALGLKGGYALSQSGLGSEVVACVLIGMIMAIVVPLYTYAYLKHRLSMFNAAAVAATYGSISAVTFVTATQFLAAQGIEYGGYLSAVMALMESPAIIIAVLLAQRARTNANTNIGDIAKDAFTEGANLLLLAALLIGWFVGDHGHQLMKPFTGDLFVGMLSFFLLDMGLQVARNLPNLRAQPPALIAYALLAPITHSLLALGLCLAFTVSLGNTVLLMVLAASASYIAVPAALKHAVPEADAAIYLGMSLGMTFPFNVLVGIPLYTTLAQYFL